MLLRGGKRVECEEKLEVHQGLSCSQCGFVPPPERGKSSCTQGEPKLRPGMNNPLFNSDRRDDKHTERLMMSEMNPHF